MFSRQIILYPFFKYTVYTVHTHIRQNICPWCHMYIDSTHLYMSARIRLLSSKIHLYFILCVTLCWKCALSSTAVKTARPPPSPSSHVGGAEQKHSPRLNPHHQQSPAAGWKQAVSRQKMGKLV